MKKFFLLFLLAGFQLVINSGNCISQQESKSGYIDLGKCSLHYEMQGEGIPLILLHAGMLDKRMWDNQFYEFAKHFKTIRYDAQLHGLSISKTDTFSHHEDLNLLMEKLGIAKAVILGLSQGGYVGIDFTIAHPEKVIALIPCAPGLTGYQFKDSILMLNQKKMQQAQSLEEAIEYIQRSWTDGPKRTPEMIDSVIRNKARQMYTENVKNMLKPGLKEERLNPPAIDRLSSINVPVFVILGDLDVSDISEIGNLIQKNVRNSSMYIINGAAHLVNMEKPSEFNKAVINFISNLKNK
jgi:3-oxoadipate enol-lactonase